jgi:Family of unknown function (DUF6582)
MNTPTFTDGQNIVEKSVDAAVEPLESEHPNGEFQVVLSTEAQDRDKENLWVNEWKVPLPARIHIDGDHGRSLEKTVGSAVPQIVGDRMIAKGSYAGTPYAQMVRQLVNEGHIRHLSVTYRETKDKTGAPQRELFNAAFVAIPTNPEAIVMSSKAAKTSQEDDHYSQYGDVTYADPENHKYPINNESRVRSAWSYINMPKNAAKYSPSKLASVKAKIRAAAKKFGIEISEDGKKEMIELFTELYSVREDDGVVELVNKQQTAGGDNPQMPTAKHDDIVQSIHNLATHLGAQCARQKITETFTSKELETLSESAEESTAADTAADKAAVPPAADESADAMAHKKATEAEKMRGLLYLIGHNIKDT